MDFRIKEKTMDLKFNQTILQAWTLMQRKVQT